MLSDGKSDNEDVHIIVLFRVKDDCLNDILVETINKTREWYVRVGEDRRPFVLRFLPGGLVKKWTW